MLRISRTPDSLPTFVTDVIEEMARRADALDLNSPQGTRSFLNYRVMPSNPSSDHYYLNDSAVGIPAVMLCHLPDDFHHTSMDTVENVDPSELNRVGFMAASAAMVLAEASAEQEPTLAATVFSHAQQRMAEVMAQATVLLTADPRPQTLVSIRTKLRQVLARESAAIASTRRIGTNSATNQHTDTLIAELTSVEEADRKALAELYAARTGSTPPTADALRPAEQSLRAIVPRCTPRYLRHFWREAINDNSLTAAEVQWLNSYDDHFDLAYMRIPEFLNFADGSRNLLEITQAVAAETFDWRVSTSGAGTVDELNTAYRPPDADEVFRLFTILRKAGLVDWQEHK